MWAFTDDCQVKHHQSPANVSGFSSIACIDVRAVYPLNSDWIILADLFQQGVDSSLSAAAAKAFSSFEVLNFFAHIGCIPLNICEQMQNVIVKSTAEPLEVPSICMLPRGYEVVEIIDAVVQAALQNEQGKSLSIPHAPCVSQRTVAIWRSQYRETRNQLVC